MKKNIVLSACLAASLISSVSFASKIPKAGEYFKPIKSHLPEGTYLETCNIKKLNVTLNYFKLIGECRDDKFIYKQVVVTFPKDLWDSRFSYIDGSITVSSH